MEEKTKESYRKLAIHHYKQMKKPAYYSAVKAYIEENAINMRPDYFRIVRNAIAFDQTEQGFHDNAKQIKTIKNPVTSTKKRRTNKSTLIKVKQKQKRVKFVNDEDRVKIEHALNEKKDQLLASVVFALQITGCRPAEVAKIKILQNNQIFIGGAKKTRHGNRGLDRVIVVPKRIHEILSFSMQHIQNKENFKIKNYQDKYDYLMKKLFPKRSHRPNFYSYRHMHGSKLKNSNFSSYEVAYLMGHQSTESIKKYGDKRFDTSRSSLLVTPAISLEEIKTLVRDNQTDYSNIANTKKKGYQKK